MQTCKAFVNICIQLSLLADLLSVVGSQTLSMDTFCCCGLIKGLFCCITRSSQTRGNIICNNKTETKDSVKYSSDSNTMIRNNLQNPFKACVTNKGDEQVTNYLTACHKEKLCPDACCGSIPRQLFIPFPNFSCIEFSYQE